jgi:3,8-divinyl chlorophyllide a/chlorophyllide a reductase subunit Z
VQISAAKQLRDRAEREARAAGDERVTRALLQRLLGQKEPA